MRSCDAFETRAKAQQSPSLKGQTMKRLHVHVSVEDISHSIGFYSALFASAPSVAKSDYAKWMLEDPRVNFAISTRGRAAGGDVVEQGQTSCCYAKSEKSWIDDPAGIAWETFYTTGENTDYGDGSGENGARVAHDKQETQSACCVPQAAPNASPACC